MENIIHLKFIFQPNLSQPTPTRPNRTPSSSRDPSQIQLRLAEACQSNSAQPNLFQPSHRQTIPLRRDHPSQAGANRSQPSLKKRATPMLTQPSQLRSFQPRVAQQSRCSRVQPMVDSAAEFCCFQPSSAEPNPA